ncbi:helix-turn-helix transcriptional regulator [Acinetobacter calcoaceticus]|uniref:winged helix-turn-helix transcriptional regulator n=1 Tax=Acinetobacter calcoaceticus TaxID=471 RepID=UPI0019022890|nr:helix-turn-helix domain-containing protein [Acinetobacter calcoaceticus]MBJ9723332.1 helix-turn-helix transcriptional regulator [Acinetobacter calcoaceticus]
MKSNDFDGMNCPIAKVMSLLNDRWGVLIMRDLFLGLRRYDELKKSTNITHATLSDRLKVLEKNELIEKKMYQVKPERYEYIPTSKGQKIGLVILMMLQLGNNFDEEEQISPQLMAVEKSSNAPISLAIIRSETQEVIHPNQIMITPGPAADETTLWRFEQAKKHQFISTESDN